MVFSKPDVQSPSSACLTSIEATCGLNSELQSASAAKPRSAVAGTVYDRRSSANIPNLVEKRPIKSKAASIKLTLAAVGLDAYELLRC